MSRIGIKQLPLLLLALLSLAGYLILPLAFPLYPSYNHAPLSDIRTFAPSLGQGLAYGALILLLYGLYLLAYERIGQEVGRRQLLLLTAILALPLLLVYPINATDIFRYFIRARIGTVYGGNPLAVAPTAFPQDPYLPLAGQWASNTSPYGPLWELAAAAVTILSSQRLLLGLLLFKALAFLAHLGSAWLLWDLLEDKGKEQQAAFTLLWAWNPAALLMFIVDGHNDVLMLFWLLLGWWLWQRRQRPLAGFLVAVLAPLTKPIGLLALPFFFLAVWRSQDDKRARWQFLAAAVTGSLGLVLLAFLPFGSPLDLAARLLQESAESPGFSPAVFLFFLLRRLNLEVSLDALNALGIFLLLLLALGLMWRTWKGQRAELSIAGIFAAYVATANTFRIWYAIWPFPWLLLAPGKHKKWLSAELTFLLTTQLSVVLYGHLRVALLKGNHEAAHLIGIPLIFGLPLIVAAIRNRPR